MKKLTLFCVLMLLAVSCRSQTIADWFSIQGTLYPVSGTDFSDPLVWQLANNTAGGITWKWTASNGSLNQVLVTDGNSPATLTWASLSAILPTDIVITDPATTGRNTIQPSNSTTVALSLKQNASGSADLLDFLNSSGSTIAFIAHDASAHFPAITNTSQGAGAVVSDATGTMTATNAGAGMVLTSNGAGIAPTFQSPTAAADAVVTDPATLSRNTIQGVTSGSAVALWLQENAVTNTAPLMEWLRQDGAASAVIIDHTGTVQVVAGGTGLQSYSQGDLLYASGSSTLSKLAKNTTASRYLSNSGTSNNPAWAQVDLTNGVTGILPSANGGTGIDGSGNTDGQLLIGKTSDHTFGLATITAGSGITVTNGPHSVTIAASGSAGVTSITGSNSSLTFTPNPITSTGTIDINEGFGNAWTTEQDIINESNTYGNTYWLYKSAGASTSGTTVRSSASEIFQANAWNTTPTASDNQVRFRITDVPTSSSSPSGILEWSGGVSAGAVTYTQLMTLSTGGVLNIETGFRVNGSATSGNYLRGNGTNIVLSALQIGDLPVGSNNQVLQTISGAASWQSSVALANGGARSLSILQAASGNNGDHLSISAGDALGTDKVGGNDTISGGRGTGGGQGGDVIAQSSAPGTSGTTLRAAAEMLRFTMTNPTTNGVGCILFPPTGSSVPHYISIADESARAGDLLTIKAGNGNGTNQAGGQITIAGGQPTGNANGGNITIGAGLGGTSGTTLRAIDRIAQFSPSGTLGHATMTLQLGHNNDITGALQFEDTSGNFVRVQINKPSGGGVTKTYNIPDFGSTGDFAMTQSGVRISTAPVAGSCTTTANSTTYFCPNTGNATGAVAPAFTNSFMVNHPCSVRNLHVYSTAVPGTAQSTQVTVYVSGNPGNNTVTLGATDQQKSDVTHHDDLSEYDYLTIEIITSATSAATTLMYSFDLTPN